MFRLQVALGFLIVLSVLSGCSSPEPVLLEGTLQSQGKPLADVLVTFVPDSDDNHLESVAGVTNQQGRFDLSRPDGRKGILPGNYRVILEDMSIYKAERTPDGTLKSPLRERFPRRFKDTIATPLRSQIRPSDSELVLELESNRATTPKD